MAKLYAELTSDKGGRVVGKGGDEYIDIDIIFKNRKLYKLRMTSQGTLYCGKETDILINVDDATEMLNS